MSKVGIIGGTFNPIHNAHIKIAEAAIAQYSLERVIFLIAGNPPHKDVDGDVTMEDRLKMTSRALSGYGYFCIDDRELYRDNKSYTYMTIQEFKQQQPGDDFYFIMGYDQFDTFDTWRNPEIISKNATILVVPRDIDSKQVINKRINDYKSKFEGEFGIVDINIIQISSSEVRKRLLNNEDVSELIDPRVLEYIKFHGLYSKPIDDETIENLCAIMEDELKKSRYYHSIGVMHACANLAMRYGYPYRRAMLAGILHDSAKCWSDDKKLKVCIDNNIEIKPVERKNPQLLHAKLGRVRAKEEYGIDDEQILHAIEVHTTGCPNMNLLDMIVFVADYIEPSRDKAPRLEEIRRMAFEDIEKCVYMILYDTVSYLENKDSAIDSMTIDTYDFYKKRIVK